MRFESFRTLMFLAVIAALLLAAQANAQSNENTIPRKVTVNTMVADRFATVAQNIGGVRDKLEQDRLLAAEIMLDLANELSPDDPELWRLSREVAKRREDKKSEMEALRQYIRLRSKDDVAQADFIVMKLDQQQTLDARVEMLENLLDSSYGQTLSYALRSRLSSYVAAAAREEMDDALFRSWLKAALDEDVTNPAAAQMAFEVIAGPNANPTSLEEAVALYGLLRANPINGKAHERLGEILLVNGAYAVAVEQFDVASRFATKAGSDEMFHSWALGLAATGERDKAVELLNTIEAVRKYQAEQDKDGPKPAEGVDVGATEEGEEPIGENLDIDLEGENPATEPGEVTLPLELELLRFAIKSRIGDGLGLQEGPFNRIVNTIRKSGEAGDALATAQLAWFHVWYNQETPAIADTIEQLKTTRGADDPFMRRIEGWRAIHAGDKELARSILTPLAEEDEFAAYGLAYIHEEGTQQRLDAMNRVVAIRPASLAAMMAAREIDAEGRTPRPPLAGRQLLALVNKKFPFPLLNPEPEKRPWLSVDLAVEPLKAGYLEPITARVRIRNVTDYPMAVGGDGPVPTNLWLYVAVRQAGSRVANVSPIVIDLRRQLRLDPNEQIEVIVPLDRGPFAGVLSNLIGQRVTYSVNAILDPRLSQQNQLLTGPLGGTDLVNLLQVGGSTPTNVDVQSWIDSLSEANKLTRARALVNMLTFAPSLKPRELTEEDLEDLEQEQIDQIREQQDTQREMMNKIVDGVNLAFPRLDPATQAWAVMHVAPAAYEQFEPLLNEARRSDQTIVRIAYVATHVNQPESPEMDEALRSDDAAVSEFARIKKSLMNRKEKVEGGDADPVNDGNDSDTQE